jgi:hypothetical protein
MTNIFANKDNNLNKRLKKISFILSSRVDEIKDNKPFYDFLFKEYLKYDNQDLNYEFNLYKKGLI